MKYLRSCIGLFFFCLSLVNLSGQISPTGRPSGGQSASFDDVIYSKDTLDAKYFFLDKPLEVFTFQDTFIRYFHEFELNHMLTQPFMHLGFPGSPARDLIAIPQAYSGFQLGLFHYDPYRMDDQNFRFFKIDKALTTVSYTQGQTQQDGIFRAKFARNFRDQIQLSIDFTRHNNQGIYANQRGKNTNLGLGLWYYTKDKRLQIYATNYTNIFDQENNGGITTDTLFNADLFEERVAIPVALTSAQTRDEQKVYQLKSTYKLLTSDTNQVDRGLLAQYILRFDKRRFRFSDTEPNPEYYGPLLQDDRGMRHFLEHNQIVNDFSLAFNGKSVDRQFVVGIKNLIHNVNQEPNSFTLTEWRAFGKLNWTLGERIRLISGAEINVNRQNAGYLAYGTLNLDLKKAGSLQGSITLNNRPPSLIERTTWLSQIQVWDNDFKTAFSNHLRVQYRLPIAQLTLAAGQLLTSNQIFFDGTGLPQQESALATLNYLEAYKMFRLGKIYNENRITLQAAGNKELFRVPGWHTQHSLYFEGRIFKNVMNFKTGFELRINSTFDGITYMPHIGQYVLDDEFDIPFYPNLDYHASFQVKFLRAFVMLQNILQPLRSDVYFQTSRYPQPDFLFRIGLGWIFIN